MTVHPLQRIHQQARRPRTGHMHLAQLVLADITDRHQLPRQLIGLPRRLLTQAPKQLQPLPFQRLLLLMPPGTGAVVFQLKPVSPGQARMLDAPVVEERMLVDREQPVIQGQPGLVLPAIQPQWVGLQFDGQLNGLPVGVRRIVPGPYITVSGAPVRQGVPRLAAQSPGIVRRRIVDPQADLIVTVQCAVERLVEVVSALGDRAFRLAEGIEYRITPLPVVAQHDPLARRVRGHRRDGLSGPDLADLQGHPEFLPEQRRHAFTGPGIRRGVPGPAVIDAIEGLFQAQASGRLSECTPSTFG